MAQDSPKLKGTLIKVDPDVGLSRRQYEDICAALGVTPSPPEPED